MSTNIQTNEMQFTAQASAPKPTSIARWVMLILCVPERQYAVLKDTATWQSLLHQTIALLVSSVAFAVTSTLFSHSLIGNSLLVSLLIGSAAGVALFFTDRRTLIDLRLNPKGGRGKAWAVRIATVAMAIMMSLLGGVESHKDDIARLQATNAKSAVTLSMKSEEYAPRVKAAESSMAQATNDAARKATLEAALTKARDDVAQAEGELKQELEGGFDFSTGKARIAERGPKAVHWEATREATNRKVMAIQAELLSLGDPSQRQDNAQSALKALEHEATEKAALQQQGPAKKLDILFQLLREEWTAWLSLGYGAALALFPEIMLLHAMARSRYLEDDYAILNQVEQQRFRSLAFRMANQVKAEIASSTKPTVVRVNTPQRKASSAASTNSFGGLDAGLAGAMA